MSRHGNRARTRPGIGPLGFGPLRFGHVQAATALLALLAGCGGADGSGAGGAPVVIPTMTPTPTPIPAPTPTPTTTPSPTPTPSAGPTPAPSGWAQGLAALYDTPANVGSCTPGTLKAAVRAEALARVNAVRALHALPPVTYAESHNGEVAQAALMMVANQALSHTPPPSWLCYTALGAQGAETSNLAIRFGNDNAWQTEDEIIAGWMNERNSASIGHRRWILNPFLGQVSYGRATNQTSGGVRYTASALKVFSFATTAPTPPANTLPAFIAYPYGDYPLRYFGAGDILSFSVLANPSSSWANAGVNFAGATITVTSGATSLPVSGVAYDNDGFGLPNNIQWRVAGLQAGVSYTVRISGVTGAPQSTYQYSFRMVP